ncbi:MAG: glycosyltransferase, partial [candidate division WOR-3 bacterium]|nr:glycosyltransferase [candidate division WOR-3 bacterium]
ANRIISSFLNLKIHDTGCSLKVFKSSVLPEIRLYGEMHRFIPYLAHARGAHIIEMPVSHRKRRSSYSKYGLSRILKVFLDMMTVKFLNEFSGSPIYAIGGLSVYTGLLSLISFIALIVMKIFFGIDMTGNPLLIISVFLGIIALQIFMLGLMSEIQVRAYFEASGREIYKIREIIENSGEDE